ncbi:MAG: hypothetical protein NBV68_13055 [Erythrobacter sp.]|uniref:hypothetical protein n=1 Tax=Erythrobacter sp. TaxID=1042 RepID=UPI0025D2DEED|nr:hypothetical protein [Erythrobacter sp.]MCM0000307.1 hypothetical protein [Erythrobacter sp.]
MILALRLLALTMALAPLAAPLAAQPAEAAASVTLGGWIARDQAMGRLAPSPERTAALDALQHDIVAALRTARAAVEAKAAAGPQPTTCLPPPGTVELTSDELGMWLSPARQANMAIVWLR